MILRGFQECGDSVLQDGCKVSSALRSHAHGDQGNSFSESGWPELQQRGIADGGLRQKWIAYRRADVGNRHEAAGRIGPAADHDGAHD